MYGMLQLWRPNKRKEPTVTVTHPDDAQSEDAASAGPYIDPRQPPTQPGSLFTAMAMTEYQVFEATMLARQKALRDSQAAQKQCDEVQAEKAISLKRASQEALDKLEAAHKQQMQDNVKSEEDLKAETQRLNQAFIDEQEQLKAWLEEDCLNVKSAEQHVAWTMRSKRLRIGEEPISNGAAAGSSSRAAIGDGDVSTGSSSRAAIGDGDVSTSTAS